MHTLGTYLGTISPVGMCLLCLATSSLPFTWTASQQSHFASSQRGWSSGDACWTLARPQPKSPSVATLCLRANHQPFSVPTQVPTVGLIHDYSTTATTPVFCRHSNTREADQDSLSGRTTAHLGACFPFFLEDEALRALTLLIDSCRITCAGLLLGSSCLNPDHKAHCRCRRL